MKYIQTEQTVEVPEGVTFNVKSRDVKITGPRGVLTKSFKHIDHVAALRTVKSLVSNMITGVTKGYKYKMRYVYAHFPINVNVVEKDGEKYIEIRNYLGDKKVRLVKVREGVTVEFSTNVKDEMVLSGNSIDNVSQNCADVQQICKARNKDIRKFLDGIYVSEKGTVVEEL
ncbi:unnamed protein product [Hanseniaspora opuntiae]